jgi:hypothetical protein
MPPTAQDILKQHGVGNSIVGPRFDPLANFDPLDPQALIHGPRNGLDMNPAIPGVRMDPMAPSTNLPPIQPLHLDPKVLDLPKPVWGLRDFEPKAPTKDGGGGPPAWLGWKSPVGVFILAVAAGLLHALMRRKISAS